ncbi:MAG: hypothetical protein IJZ68_09535 [Bacteroidaceae bacterium]|nr:hypothetical protein [Bacteroidaceae bacterium]
MNKPVQTLVDLCQDESLTKAREALVKSYEQHMKAVNDLRTAVKKAMTEAIQEEDFEALGAYQVLLEKAKTYADQLEELQEAKPAKKSKKAE